MNIFLNIQVRDLDMWCGAFFGNGLKSVLPIYQGVPNPEYLTQEGYDMHVLGADETMLWRIFLHGEAKKLDPRPTSHEVLDILWAETRENLIVSGMSQAAAETLLNETQELLRNSW